VQRLAGIGLRIDQPEEIPSAVEIGFELLDFAGEQIDLR